MPVTPVPRFTMQDWRESDDCCETVALADAQQHRFDVRTQEAFHAEEVIDYERITPPISAFLVGANVRVRPPEDQSIASPMRGRTGVITGIVQVSNGQARDGIVITYDIRQGSFASGQWTPDRVEVISFAERIFAARDQLPTVPPVETDMTLANWERELLTVTNPASVAAAPYSRPQIRPQTLPQLPSWNITTSAGANIFRDWANSINSMNNVFTSLENTVQSTTEAFAAGNFMLAPQSEEDTQMNLAQITEKLIVNYIERQGDTAKLLLDTKVSRVLGVDARSIRRELKKYIDALSWADRATIINLRADKRDGVIKINGSASWMSNGVEVNNLLPAVIPLATALLVLKGSFPDWVDLEADHDHGIVKLSTARGEAFAMALRDALQSDFCTFGVRGMTADRFAQAISNATRFRSGAAQAVFGCMKTIARRSIVARKEGKSSTGNFDHFMSNLRATRKSSDVILSRFVIPAHGLVSSRQWGIEVETAGARGVDTPGGWDAKSDSSLESAYNGDDDEQECDEDHEAQRYDGRRSYNNQYVPNPNWTDPEECEACIANAEREDGDGYRDCREFVSPILHSFHSKGLEKLVEQIATQPQNDTAGIHVHVDVSDLTPKQIGSLVYGYQIIEPLIEASYQRDVREYCKARRNGEVLSVIKQAKDFPTMRTRDISTDTRYVALNLDSIRAHGTVEFRAMGPVYDYEYLIRWAYFCRELVNVAKADISQGEWNAVDSFDKLAALFIRRGAESVDTQLSTISDEDIAAMIRKNSFDVSEDVYATVGGEI